MMKDSEAHLRKGSSVYIYPEGTRSKTGEVGRFKSGAFTLAKRAGVPVLIIGIRGSGKAIPKGDLLFSGRHHMQVAVLGEIDQATVESQTAKELADMARDRIVSFLEMPEEEAVKQLN